MINLQFTSKRHKHHFNVEKEYINANNKKLLAAIYLLTADKNVWMQCRRHIEENDIDFENIHPKNLSSSGYTYYLTAKGILWNAESIEIEDMLDPFIISDDQMRIIMSAFALVREYPFKRCISRGKGVGGKNAHCRENIPKAEK